MDSSSTVVITLIVVVLIYFLPSFVAAGRERNGGVFVLNLFLGWTLIGWVVALAWAASLEKEKPKPAAGGKSFDHAGDPVPEKQTVPCPFCAEDIKPAAVVCKHCGRDLPAKESTP